MAEEVSAQQEPNGANGSIMPPPAASTNGVLATADMPINTTTNLSADEIALYDRQIRLWGAQAQEYIRSAHVLLVSLRALGTEIAKNLTLAGISSLTIVDDSIVTEEDLGAQYFLREEDVGKPVSSFVTSLYFPYLVTDIHLRSAPKLPYPESRASTLASPSSQTAAWPTCYHKTKHTTNPSAALLLATTTS